MIIKENEYIVKAKNVNIEIHKETKEKDIIRTLILVLISVVSMFFYTPLLAALSIDLLFIICTIGLLIYSKWDLIIKEKKIYINNGPFKCEINYANLVNCKSKIYYKKKRKIYKLEIEYLENNKFKMIYLTYYPEMQPMISEICRSFITNKEVTRYQNNINDYFDIRDNKLDNIILTKKEKENKLKNIIVIIAIIVFLIMFLSIPFLEQKV